MKNSIIVTILFTCLFAFTANAQFNLAKRTNVTATQSSNYKNGLGSASLAIDGNTDGRWNSKSVSHTKDGGTLNPWWKVNLGSLNYVKEILIWNRTDCCKQRLDNLVVSVYNGSNWVRVNKTNHRYSSGIQYPLKFTVNKVASYVKVQLMNPKGILSLAEVQVIGDKWEDTKSSLSHTGRNLKGTGKVIGNETVKITKKGVNTVKTEIKKIEEKYAAATSIGAPKKCEGSSFLDIKTGSCYSCPTGYKRTIFDIKGGKACERAGKELFKKTVNGGKGKGLLGTDCSQGYFWDPNGSCYKCPSGYKRTAYGVTSGKACSKTVKPSFSKAKFIKYSSCNNSYAIFDVGTGKCWRCPVGYGRTVFSVEGSKACVKKN